MAGFRNIPVAEIAVPEGIRPVDEGHAQAMQSLLQMKGCSIPLL